MLVHTNSLRRTESSPGQEAEESLQMELEDSGTLVESLAAGYEWKKRAVEQAVESLLAHGHAGYRRVERAAEHAEESPLAGARAGFRRGKRAVQQSEENLQIEEQNSLLAGGYTGFMRRFNSGLGWDWVYALMLMPMPMDSTNTVPKDITPKLVDIGQFTEKKTTKLSIEV